MKNTLNNFRLEIFDWKETDLIIRFLLNVSHEKIHQYVYVSSEAWDDSYYFLISPYSLTQEEADQKIKAILALEREQILKK